MTINYLEGVGVTPRQLIEPGTAVMVPVGAIAALTNGGPCVIAWAVVRGPVEEGIAAEDIRAETQIWLDVYMIPGGEPLPQMYPAGQILGVPALGVSMDGAPERVLR